MQEYVCSKTLLLEYLNFFYSLSFIVTTQSKHFHCRRQTLLVIGAAVYKSFRNLNEHFVQEQLFFNDTFINKP